MGTRLQHTIQLTAQDSIGVPVLAVRLYGHQPYASGAAGAEPLCLQLGHSAVGCFFQLL